MPDAFFCISVVIWVYVSSVKDALVCPRMPDKVFASTPLVRAWVAKVCLSSWKRKTEYYSW